VDIDIRQQLQQLTAEFYSVHANAFDESRQGGWDSWGRVLDEMLAITPFEDLLDLGCGNGRFANFLDANDSRDIHYTGIDSEPALIAYAQDRHPAKVFDVDTIEHTLQTTKKYDAVVSFGVLHHLPGQTQRTALLHDIAKLLKPDGVAAFSFWQPKLLKNFGRKIHPDPPIASLETNDFLLGWKGDFTHVRYCHHFESEEITQLFAESGLVVRTEFQGGGNDASNRYVVARKTL
jgi:2-polyprenyl-3-methyl-5-hydroxy-6-metoxy-1,4-benzoquinol methylase